MILINFTIISLRPRISLSEERGFWEIFRFKKGIASFPRAAMSSGIVTALVCSPTYDSLGDVRAEIALHSVAHYESLR